MSFLVSWTQVGLPSQSRWAKIAGRAADIIVERNDKAIMIPSAAVVTFAGVQKVLLVKDGKAREQRVRTGRRDGDLV